MARQSILVLPRLGDGFAGGGPTVLLSFSVLDEAEIR